ncbi:DUF2971 domain-containing protein [Ruegeria faecimaris]|uniref:DUF2971 domain-containing protein n=1 Tax=Ruegeria faecimaris TaxID=686389 RepID=UPI0023315912|nr:DUF2971 domain-containing protein [Ruegeria faecimaris]
MSNNVTQSTNNFPEFLYRYRSNSTRYACQDLKQAIGSRMAYFSSLPGQNDPFDCNPSFKTSSAQEIVDYFKKHRPGKLIVEEETVSKLFPRVSSPGERRRIRKAYRPNLVNIERVMHTGEALLQEQRRKAHICCFSESWDNPLMWSHYSNSHRGYCIKYRVREDLMQRFDDRFPLKVKYSSKRPKLTMIDLLKFADAVKGKAGNYSQNEVLNALAYQKPDEWEYEKEWRVHSLSEPRPGYKAISALEPVEVILGANSDNRIPEIIRRRVDERIPISKVNLSSQNYSICLKPA